MDLDVEDVRLYQHGFPHAVFERIRAADAVYANPGSTPFLAITRYRDALAVLKDPLVYSSQLGGVSIEDPSPEMQPILGAMLPALDPPEHMQLRRKLFPPLKSGSVERLAASLLASCRALLRNVLDRGEVDFVSAVAASVPIDAFGLLMGLSRDEIEPMRRCTDAVISQGANNSQAHVHALFEELDRLLESRRRHPGDDYLSLLASVDIGDEPMTRLARNGMLLQIIVGGLETTRNALSGTLLALDGHRDQLALMRGNAALLKPAIDESLRFVSPVNYVRRTTRVAAGLADRTLPPGSRVVVFLAAANRDPEQFADPHRFDITRRDPGAHLAFGAGEHFCMGAALARLELCSFWTAFLELVADFEILAPGTRVASVQQNAIARLPVALRSLGNPAR
jgi:cytochrome P450